MAHSLKTPLASLSLALSEPGRDPTSPLANLSGQIDTRVRRHLARARAGTGAGQGRSRTDVDNGKAVITIADNGPGIPQHAVDIVLQLGQRLDQTVPGPGLAFPSARISLASRWVLASGGCRTIGT